MPNLPNVPKSAEGTISDNYTPLLMGKGSRAAVLPVKDTRSTAGLLTLEIGLDCNCRHAAASAQRQTPQMTLSHELTSNNATSLESGGVGD